MGPADRAGTGKIDEFTDPVTAMNRKIPPILCIECVCRRVKEIAAHRGCKSKHGRVAGTEEVDAG